MLLHEQDLDDIVVDKLRLEVPPTDLSEWRAVVAAKQNPEAVVDIGMVGKYVQIRDSYISLNESLMHGGIKTRTRVNIHYFESQDIERSGAVGACTTWMRSWCRAASAIAASRARSRRFASRARIAFPTSASAWACSWPSSNTRATCSRSRAPTARSSIAPRNHPVIALITEWQDLARGQQVRDEKSDLGGTMRLGAQEARLMPGSLVHSLYGKESIFERHRHRYEFNNHYLEELDRRGADASPASRPTAWWSSSNCPAILGSWRASSIRSSPRRRATGIRCSPASFALRASIAPRCSRAARPHEAHRAAHEAERLSRSGRIARSF